MKFVIGKARWVPVVAPLVFGVLGYVFLLSADQRFRERSVEDCNALREELVEGGMDAKLADVVKAHELTATRNAGSAISSAASTVLMTTMTLSIVIASFLLGSARSAS